MQKTNKQIYASAARTATPTAAQVNTTGAQAVHAILDVTAFVTALDLVLTIDAYDDESDTWYNILTGGTVSSVSTNVYKIGPGLTESANAIVADFVPDKLRFTVTHGNANSSTYSLSVNEIH